MGLPFRLLLLSNPICRSLVKQGHVCNPAEMLITNTHGQMTPSTASFAAFITLAFEFSAKSLRPETRLMHSRCRIQDFGLTELFQTWRINSQIRKMAKKEQRIRIYAHSPFEVPIIPPSALHTSKAHSIIHSRWNIHIYFGTVFRGTGFRESSSLPRLI